MTLGHAQAPSYLSPTRALTFFFPPVPPSDEACDP